jgi:hypothetical protein
MLDVHPPHEAAHTWKDFFIHIATICVGLLIAIGLEQTVEAIHQHRERHELMEQLNAENQQILKYAEHAAEREELTINWYAARLDAMQAVLTQQQPYRPPVRPVLAGANSPGDPVWRAAKASGRTSILSEQSVIANSEIEELLIEREAAGASAEQIATGPLTLACARLPLQPGTLQSDYAHADKHELQDCLVTLMTFYQARRTLYARSAYVIGAEKAILAGETDIDSISRREAEELGVRFSKLQPAPIPQ